MGRGVGGNTAPYVGDISLYFCGIMSALMYASKPHTLLSNSVCCLSSKTYFFTHAHTHSRKHAQTQTNTH